METLGRFLKLGVSLMQLKFNVYGFELSFWDIMIGLIVMSATLTVVYTICKQ